MSRAMMAQIFEELGTSQDTLKTNQLMLWFTSQYSLYKCMGVRPIFSPSGSIRLQKLYQKPDVSRDTRSVALHICVHNTLSDSRRWVKMCELCNGCVRRVRIPVEFVTFTSAQIPSEKVGIKHFFSQTGFKSTNRLSSIALDYFRR